MKITLSLSLACLMLASSCSKSDPSTGTAEPPVPVHRNHGQPIGAMVTKTIGPNGGTLSSGDGVLTLTIDAGTVDANTEFSIQPVENMISTRGGAYRLKPENTVFKKPVKIQFSYAGLGTTTAQASLLFPAFQDAQGNYYEPKNVEHNSSSKTLVIATKHFSDWTFGSRVDLLVNGSLPSGPLNLSDGGSAQFQLVKYLTDQSHPDAYEDGVPLLEDLGFATLARISWSKTGSGNLTGASIKATYSAPAKVTANETLQVSADVRDDNLGKDNLGNPIRQMILSQTINLTPSATDESFFELVEDGVKIRLTNPRFSMAGGYMSITGERPDNFNSISISIRASATGAYAWDQPGAAGKASMNYIQTNVGMFTNFRIDDCTTRTSIFYSPGQVNVSTIATVINGFHTGNFSGEVYDAVDWCSSKKMKKLSGSYKIRKTY